MLRCFDVGEPVLKKAFEHRLKLGKQPRYAVLCNFQRLRLYDFSNLARTVVHECGIDELPEKAELFKFLLPEEDSVGFLEQPGVDIKAARAVADLHGALTADGYGGRDLEVLLTRLIFCFFGDDTGIFGENTQIHRLLLNSAEDGSDLGSTLSKLFEVLDTSVAKRSTKLPAKFADFAYVNGRLFSESCRLPDFDAAQRAVILQCSALNWGSISPAIFGSLFQAVLETGREDAKKFAAARRELGAHYTSERNILRALGPLFLDELQAELEAAKRNKDKLQALHKRLEGIRLLDPACGCGNFLVVAFQQLRLLEIELVHRLHGDATKSRGLLDMRDLLRVQVDQFYGIEIDASAAHIARVALWITDHQMNLVAAQRLGQARPSVPLTHSATIAEGNALRLDWAAVLPPGQCSYVVGNPPFVGRQHQSDEQKTDLEAVYAGLPGSGVLDYVAAWYVKAARYIQASPAVTAAFVSTNSITQGEQVGVLWGWMLARGMKIQFAHRTFQWSNDAMGVAAVHCVILGFGTRDQAGKRIFAYPDIKDDPVEIAASQINPYLVDAPDVFLDKRRKPLCANAPEIVFGNMPNDDGHLLLSPDEEQGLRTRDLIAAKYLRRFLGADEFINDKLRYCLWLKDSTATDRKASPEIRRRAEAVRALRQASNRAATKKLADTPHLFGEIRHTDRPYVVVPLHSSENRNFVPIGYFNAEVICGNANSMLPDASLYDFGLLCSTMHNAWMRTVCGRIKSDYRYSNTIVYNNFAWPEQPTDKHRKAIEAAAQAVLDERDAEKQRCAKQQQACSLATLYDPLTMPPELRKAHQKLDKAIDAAYGYTGKPDDTERVAFLFGRYQQLVDSEASGKAK